MLTPTENRARNANRKQGHRPSWKVINLDDWAEIRYLFSTGKHSKREIGRIVGVPRGTVDRALESDRAPKYQRAAGVSSFDAFAPGARELLVKFPTMPAATLAERVGWSGSASLFRAKVAAIRPEYAAADPADRLVHEPGFQVQCDPWFPHDPLPVGGGQADTPPVLVMTSAFSGFIQARMLPSRTTPDLIGGPCCRTRRPSRPGCSGTTNPASAGAGPRSRWPRSPGRETPSAHRGNCSTQTQLGDVLQVRKAQDRTQLFHPALCRPGRHPSEFPQKERIDVRPGQIRWSGRATGRGLLEQAACNVLITQHSGWSKTPLLDQPRSILSEQRTQRRQQRRGSRGNANLPQIA
jgi:hypothetical protein